MVFREDDEKEKGKAPRTASVTASLQEELASRKNVETGKGKAPRAAFIQT
jgi:hypothetical protein